MQTLDPAVVPIAAVSLEAPADGRFLEVMPDLIMHARRTPDPVVIAVLPIAVLQAQRSITPAIAKFCTSLDTAVRRHYERRDEIQPLRHGNCEVLHDDQSVRLRIFHRREGK